MSSQEVNDIRHENAREILRDHEDRITQNERFRLEMQGALKFAAFMIGGGAAFTIASLVGII